MSRLSRILVLPPLLLALGVLGSLGTASATAAPVNGVSVALVPVLGQVLVQRPGASEFTPLDGARTVPVGSTIDTTRGTVQLTSVDAAGKSQSARFHAGLFQVAQPRGIGLVTLRLKGEIGGCANSPGPATSPNPYVSRGPRATASVVRGRRLWGNGLGNFRTTGNFGSATVRGTVWFTEDRCRGTLFEVKRGVVSVRDNPAGRTLSLPAGKHHWAHI